MKYLATSPGKTLNNTKCVNRSRQFHTLDLATANYYSNDVSILLNLPDCNCGVAGDINNDASTDPLDVSYLVNKVYLSLDALCDRCNE